MSINMTKNEIIEGIKKLAPFYYDIELPYGLRTNISELNRRKVKRTRLVSFINHAFPSILSHFGGTLQGKRVLDVGCNCGGFSIEAAKKGAEYVMGIDVVDHYIEQANFLKDVLELRNIEFIKSAVEELDKSLIGQFDITFCFGILYHFENPILAMRKLSSLTRSMMVVDTNIIPIPFIKRSVWFMNFLPGVTPDSLDVSTGLWRKDRICQFKPNAYAVTELLKYLGFPIIKRINPFKLGLEKRYYFGRRATFIAIRN